MKNFIYFLGIFLPLVTNSYATSIQDPFDDLWKKNVTKPSYEDLFFDGKDVFLKEKQNEKDIIFQKNTKKSDYKDQKVLSINHKGETITIKTQKK